MQGHSAFPMAGSNQYSGTGTSRFLTGESAYRLSEPMANLGGGTQSSPSGVRDASSWGSNVVPSLVHPGSSHRGTRNIPQEVKNLRYSGLTEWGPFYLQFRRTAEYYGWCEADYLFALSLALTGTALKFFNILLNRGEVMTFSSVVASLGERFGKGTLSAARHLEFNSMTQGWKESVEQRCGRVMEAAQYVLGTRVSGSVLQEQATMRFAIGCNDPSAGR